jgi:TetR/AcrR family transcriptional regulator, cholesterol catabolism regulator
MIKTAAAPEAAPPGDGTETRRFSEPARRLLKAADDLFYAQGVPATTVREITSACGLSPGAMYNHFSSKDELLYVLVRHRHLRLERDVAEAQCLAAGHPTAELVAIVQVYIRTHIGGQRGTQVANREYRHLTKPRLEEMIGIRRRLRDRTVAVLREGSKTGVFKISGGSDTRSLNITAAALLEMCINCSQWVRRGGAMSIEELERRFVELALRMVGCVDELLLDRGSNPPGTLPSQR